MLPVDCGDTRGCISLREIGGRLSFRMDTESAPPGPKTGPRRYPKKYWWSVAIAVPLLIALIGIIPSLLKKESKGINISRDSHDLNFQQITVIESEYRQKTGQPLRPRFNKKSSKLWRS